jgi:hypothetical protein
MLTRLRNLLILAALALGASVAAGRFPAIARHYDSQLTAAAAHHSDCPYHRAHGAWSAGVSRASAAPAPSSAPPEGSIFYPGRAAVFTP